MAGYKSSLFSKFPIGCLKKFTFLRPEFAKGLFLDLFNYKTSRASFWFNLYKFDKGQNLTFLRLSTLDDLQWASRQFFSKIARQELHFDVQSEWIMFEIWSFRLFLLFLTLNDLYWPSDYWKGYVIFPTFRDFEIWPHLISNYWTSSGRTDYSSSNYWI